MSLTPKGVEALTNKLIEKMAGGRVTFYATGSKRPNYVGHELTHGALEVLTYQLADPPAVMNFTDGKLYIQLGEQTYSYDNYSVPNLFRIYTSDGEEIYQGYAYAHGREKNGGNQVLLVSKMLHDEYMHPGNTNFITNSLEYTVLPPNYKCELTNFAIRIN